MSKTTSSSAVFSLPINPKLDPGYIEEGFIPFLNKHKHLIYDLYFTSRMPPFTQDAMGDVFKTTKSAKDAAKNALAISEATGIPLSATFNNIWVRPDQKNLDLWIENFKFLYDSGVRTVTLPHTSWVMTGQIQKEYPDLKIKNTILREVVKPNEIVTLASSGFHYINLDRDIMRDRDAFEMILKAKEYCANKGNPIELSLLVNEHCWGGCPIMPEHYQYNSTRQGTEPQYFNSEISRISCSRWDAYDAAAELKRANLPPWREDWQWFLDNGIDVFKLHGREDAMRLRESLDIIERWDNGDELMHPEFKDYMVDLDMPQSPINLWRDKIKTCKFDCWDCNFCESVVESKLKKQERDKLNPLVEYVTRAIDGACDNNSNFNPEGYDVLGLSSSKVRHLLNNLCSDKGTVYADVGCYTGSTLIAALMGNKAVKAYAIDDFSDETVYPMRKELRDGFNVENPAEVFIENYNKWYNPNCAVGLVAKPIAQVEFNPDYPPKVVFYDAENDPNHMRANLQHIHKQCADDGYVLVVDDANFEGVVSATDEFLKDKNVAFKRLITTETPEDADDWWNGVYIIVIEK